MHTLYFDFHSAENPFFNFMRPIIFIDLRCQRNWFQGNCCLSLTTFFCLFRNRINDRNVKRSWKWNVRQFTQVLKFKCLFFIRWRPRKSFRPLFYAYEGYNHLIYEYNGSAYVLTKDFLFYMKCLVGDGFMKILLFFKVVLVLYRFISA